MVQQARGLQTMVRAERGPWARVPEVRTVETGETAQQAKRVKQ
jgi:hypothetical protein